MIGRKSCWNDILTDEEVTRGASWRRENSHEFVRISGREHDTSLEENRPAAEANEKTYGKTRNFWEKVMHSSQGKCLVYVYWRRMLRISGGGERDPGLWRRPFPMENSEFWLQNSKFQRS
ncbi:hypothetical protein Scep_016372 [Stephania cephalantha]|uniref:Uncharacterized protein n=1 Tax=Stephania cephalantha TaxID=152367 RepID=A0AAP0IMH9_9MAGN